MMILYAVNESYLLKCLDIIKAFFVLCACSLILDFLTKNIKSIFVHFGWAMVVAVFQGHNTLGRPN